MQYGGDLPRLKQDYETEFRYTNGSFAYLNIQFQKTSNAKSNFPHVSIQPKKFHADIYKLKMILLI